LVIRSRSGRLATSARLIAEPGIVQHRPLQRRAGRQALDLLGKPRLEGAMIRRNWFA
jgi:hypothetical protein